MIRDLFSKTGLYLIYSPAKVNASKLLEFIIKDRVSILVDVKQTWSSQKLSSRTHVLQPLSQKDTLLTIHDLPQFISPRLELIIVDNLLLFFRDHYDQGQSSIRNRRIFAYSMALLNNLGRNIPVIIRGYSDGINPNFPVMKDIAEYYCDDIFYLSSADPFLLESTITGARINFP